MRQLRQFEGIKNMDVLSIQPQAAAHVRQQLKHARDDMKMHPHAGMIGQLQVGQNRLVD